MARRPALRLMFAFAAGAFLVAPPVAADDDAVPRAGAGVVDTALADTAAAAPGEIVHVWVLFAEQHAARALDDLRPGYDLLLDAATARARAALARIDPFLPPRDVRSRMTVADVMTAERALLTAAEVADLQASREATRRLAQELRDRVRDLARPACDADQEPVATYLAGVPGAAVEARTTVLNALLARIPASEANELVRRFPSIERIERAGRPRVNLATSVPTIGAANWTSASYLGGGERVAIVDTGVDASHPAFTTSSGSAVVVASTVQLAAGALDPAFADNASSTDDAHAHGTHCAGIVASNGSGAVGVAPGTSLLNAKCFYLDSGGYGSGEDADIVSAVDWALNNGVTVFSCSFGAGATPNGGSALTRFFDAVAEVSGVPVALAAGNSGSGSGTLNTPGDGFNVLTVGAFDDNATTSLTDDFLASYSSRGPSSDGRRKPDLAAPGSNISSTYAHWEGGTRYVSLSGTSMATPHAAGTMALLLSYNTNWTPEALKALLANTCRNTSPVSGVPDSNWGAGALDAGAAYASRTLPVTGTFTSTGTRTHYYAIGAIAAGARSSLAWNRAVAFAGGNPSGGGGTARSLVNLDLLVYDGTTGAQSAASSSSADSLEQARVASALTDAVVVVNRTGNFPSGKTSQRYALAPAAAATSVNPPALTISSTSAPAFVKPGATFTVTATLRNTGDLRAPSPVVTLTLPTGFSFATGSAAAQTLSTLDPFAAAGVEGTAAWSVVAGTTGGSVSLSAAASSSGFGGTFTSGASSRTVTLDGVPPAANAGADVSLPATSAAGRTITLDASASTDNNGSQGLSLAWDTDADGDFGDALGSATGVAPAVTFGLGTRTVALRVTDAAGNVGTDTVVVTVTDEPPTARAGADRGAAEGAAVAFDGSASTDNEGAIGGFAWTFGDGGTATGVSPSHVFRDEGTYTVTLTVTDSVGQSASDTAIVTVTNVAPSASAGTAAHGVEGAEIAFSGGATDPGASDVLSFAWAFGDGGTAAGAAVSHAYADEGVYTAVLTVSDGDGGSSQASVEVTVTNAAPVANAGGTVLGDEGASVTFAGSATDAGVSDVLTFAWDFGDGSSGSGASPSHVYAADGVYTATLTVTDGDGGTGTSSVTAIIANAPPAVGAGVALSGVEGAPVAFAGTATDAGASDVLTYAWTFGDGATAAGRTATHAYADEGDYTAVLTVTDDGGLSATSTFVVTIANVAPTADAGGARAGAEGAAIAFAGAASDPGTDALAASWTFGDGGSASGLTASHVYAQDGTYTATFVVADGDGGFAASTSVVTVANVAPAVSAGFDVAAGEGDAVAFAAVVDDPGVLDAVTVAWDFGDGDASADAAATHVYRQDGVYDARCTATDDRGAATVATRRITVTNVAPSLALPAAVGAEAGDVFRQELAAGDASPDDAAALALTWRIDDARGVTVAEGTGASVAWQTGAPGAYTLRATVADDHASVGASAALTVTVPSLESSFGAVAAAELDGATERRVFDLLLAARADVLAGRRPARAAKAVRSALRLMAKHGAADGPLTVRLAAIADGLDAGTPLSAPVPLDVSETKGDADRVLETVARCGLDDAAVTRLLTALLDLRAAHAPRAASKARRRALDAVAWFPPGPFATWLAASIPTL